MLLSLIINKYNINTKFLKIRVHRKPMQACDSKREPDAPFTNMD